MSLNSKLTYSAVISTTSYIIIKLISIIFLTGF